MTTGSPDASTDAAARHPPNRRVGAWGKAAGVHNGDLGVLRELQERHLTPTTTNEGEGRPRTHDGRRVRRPGAVPGLRDALTLLREHSDDSDFRLLVDDVLAGRCSLVEASGTAAFSNVVFASIAQEFDQLTAEEKERLAAQAVVDWARALRLAMLQLRWGVRAAR
ncbi:MAG: hypothetical protein DLM60_14125 [Pseudonocardiales bacterium]|nr:MAG: hypothetical protein DLM60_14125 [Pseudonocardiales bacterium]